MVTATETQKEPWEMTRDDFITKGLAKDEAVKRNIGQTLNIPMVRQHWSVQHETLIKDAIREGKPVPPEVLKDYPELAKGTPVTPEVTPKGKLGFRDWRRKYGKGTEADKPGSYFYDKDWSAWQKYYFKEPALPKAPITPKARAKPALPTIKPSPDISYKDYAGLKQTPRGRAQDLRQLHATVIEGGSPRTKRWLSDPGSMDVTGIDTPPITKRSPRLSGGRGPRITPKRPRLKR